MPIYKVARRGEQDKQARRLHGRWRAAALLASGLLALATAALLLHTRHILF